MSPTTSTGYRHWRKLRRRVARHLFQDRGGAATPTVLVAGVARSGTTWLAELLASKQPARVMFEPFYTVGVPEYRTFEYLQYMRPEEENPELFAFADKVLRGRIRNPGWIDRFTEALFPRLRVVKVIRAGLLLRWLNDHFPDVPAIFIVRHPCAVVSSHLTVGWSTEEDLASILRQPKLVEDHLAAHADWIGGLSEDYERHAALWCIGNLVALRQSAGGSLPVVFYEHLVRRPTLTLPAVFEALGLDYDPAVLGSLKRRSVTVFEGSPLLAGRNPAMAWMSRLSPDQAQRIMEIVRRFGLDHLYTDDGQPAFEAGSLHQEWL